MYAGSIFTFFSIINSPRLFTFLRFISLILPLFPCPLLPFPSLPFSIFLWSLLSAFPLRLCLISFLSFSSLTSLSLSLHLSFSSLYHFIYRCALFSDFSLYPFISLSSSLYSFLYLHVFSLLSFSSLSPPLHRVPQPPSLLPLSLNTSRSPAAGGAHLQNQIAGVFSDGLGVATQYFSV